MMTAEGARSMFTIQEAASYLGYSERHLRRLIVLGHIEKRQAYPNARVLITRESCERFLRIQSN